MFQSGPGISELQLAIRGNRVRGTCWISFGGEGQPFEHRCIIDTGAQITVIPQKVWERFSSNIDIDSLPEKSIRGVGGRPMKALQCSLELLISGKKETPLRLALGACDVRLAYDAEAAKRDRTRELEDGESEQDRVQELQHILLGLGGGPLINGGICINWKDQHAVFVQEKHP